MYLRERQCHEIRQRHSLSGNTTTITKNFGARGAQSKASYIFSYFVNLYTGIKVMKIENMSTVVLLLYHLPWYYIWFIQGQVKIVKVSFFFGLIAVMCRNIRYVPANYWTKVSCCWKRILDRIGDFSKWGTGCKTRGKLFWHKRHQRRPFFTPSHCWGWEKFGDPTHSRCFRNSNS